MASTSMPLAAFHVSLLPPSRKMQADEERRFQRLFFGESRRGARKVSGGGRDECALAQTT